MAIQTYVPKSIDEYILKFPPEIKEILNRLNALSFDI